ncbi:NADP-dependent oxidoreductase domain-containing protein [Mycena rosella]|uniref:NADP-dependent oxidoreductase domain-containing protein n=1 Tax=Mycena rosella TaxID=1033263 RepID=A0AAD7CU46_MYCRO|nr:NADP-dependent oxidoreductase domain-containing protein [Mycena rosella]
MSIPIVKLNSGYEIPILGLGTWQSKPEEVTTAVEYALKETSLRHIDCAFGYGNEKDVGAGIAAAGVPRSELFITSKLWGTWHSRVEECLDQTLANLGTDYLDLYLVHWPIALNPNGNHPLIPTLPDGKRDVVHSWDLKDTWKQMEALVKKGKVRSIGVSNFSEMNLEKILPTAEIIPAVDQLELHIYNPQHKLLAYLRSKGIHPQAFSPLGSTGSPLFSDETVTALATKYGLQPTDILIGYLIAKDIVTLPKSVTPSRIASNTTGPLAALAKLQPADIEALDGLAAAGKQKRFIMPPWPVNLGFENWP